MFRPHGSAARATCGVVVLLFLCGDTLAGNGGTVPVQKTGPLRASDTYSLQVFTHALNPIPPWAGWAGIRVKVHITDGTEIDGGSISNVFPPVAGTGTPLVPTQAVFHTYFDPSAPQSGRDLPVSVEEPLPIYLNFHVAGSDPSGNDSQADVTVMFWDIYHVRGGLPGSTRITLRPSDLLYVTSQFPPEIGPTNPGPLQHLVGNDPTGLPLESLWQLPEPNPTNPDRHWAHIFETMVFHIPPGGLGSQFYAVMNQTISVGIEHVPEPAAAVLAGAGMASLMVGLVLRRRRNRVA